MDGVFVAYHNTARMFGFQYVPIAEMEQRLYGPGHPDRGARIFEKCIGLLEAISNEIVACFPKQVSWHALPFLYYYSSPVPFTDSTLHCRNTEKFFEPEDLGYAVVRTC